MPDSQSIRRGIGLMLAGMFLFALNDTLGKYMVAAYSVGMLMLVRSFGGLAIIAPRIWREGGLALVARAFRPRLAARSLLSVAESVLFYWAVVYLPVADVVTFYMAVPIFTTAMAALFLGEKVRWRRWSAIGVGFIGVIIALDPTSGVFSLGATVALAGAISFALVLIVTRRMREETDTVLITGQTLMGLIIGLITLPLPALFPGNATVPLVFGWKHAPPLDLALLALLGVVATIAHMLVTRSVKIAPASIVVPFQYVTIIWVTILGYLVFGDLPAMSRVIGCAIIIGAGLYIFSREKALSQGKG
jgi:drug/metabolite transporter (DMT)-like permease